MDDSCLNARRIRKEMGMSLRELSAKSGLSVSYLSNYENGKVNITIHALRQIAKALDVSVKTLLAAEEDSTVLVVPSGKRYSIVNRGDPQGELSGNYIQDFLTRGSSFDMQVTVVHMEPHSISGVPDHHEGEEFIYILEGSVVLVFKDRQEIVLSKGDMAYYDAHYNHCWKNTAENGAEFLAVASRKGF